MFASFLEKLKTPPFNKLHIINDYSQAISLLLK